MKALTLGHIYAPPNLVTKENTEESKPLSLCFALASMHSR